MVLGFCHVTLANNERRQESRTLNCEVTELCGDVFGWGFLKAYKRKVRGSDLVPHTPQEQSLVTCTSAQLHTCTPSHRARLFAVLADSLSVSSRSPLEHSQGRLPNNTASPCQPRFQGPTHLRRHLLWYNMSHSVASAAIIQVHARAPLSP
jgi:hypothetical protein